MNSDIKMLVIIKLVSIDPHLDAKTNIFVGSSSRTILFYNLDRANCWVFSLIKSRFQAMNEISPASASNLEFVVVKGLSNTIYR